MKRLSLGLILSAAFLSAGLTSVPVSAAASCESLAALKLPDTTITGAEAVAAGPSALLRGAGAEHQGPPRPLQDTGPAELPAFCRVQLTVAPAIEIEVWLPASGWNGDFEAVGNGGKAGAISYAAMGTGLKAGYATASTDTGHDQSKGAAGWALNQPGLVADFAYRAVHKMTVAAVKVIAAYYGNAPKYTYFNGCSTGGRQGLMEAQRYPADYNGILAGDPVAEYTRVQIDAPFWVTFLSHKDPESYIPVSKLAAINEASVAACDGLDGVKDGLIDDPRKCTEYMKNPSIPLCKDADAPTCLTAKQMATLKMIYAGLHDEHGTQLYPGTMPGHEMGWAMSLPSDPAKPLNDDSATGRIGFFKYFVFNDPNWDYRTWDFDKDLPLMEKKLASVINATDPNLKPFQEHGSKLLLYHGWTDTDVSPLATIHYYRDAVSALTGAKADEQEGEAFAHNADRAGNTVRLFMVPGMDHCGGGPGPNQFDAFDALANWVEHKQAPEKIIASHVSKGAVDRTRPLCPYPQTAQYTGQGSIDDSANFVCKAPVRN